MNAMKEFLKNYAIGYAAGFISTTVLRDNKPQRCDDRPAQPHEEKEVKAKAKPPRIGRILEDGTFVEREDRPAQPHEEKEVKAKAKSPRIGHILEDGTFVE